MKRGLMIHLAMTFSVCAVSSPRAHHSHPYFYDHCSSITIEGRLESVRWVDRHTVIVLRLDDGTAYTVDWNGLGSLTSRGVLGPAQAALVPGARIAVAGDRIRSTAEIRERFPDFAREVNPNTVDPTLIRRVDDGWNWTRTPSDRMPTSAQAPCAAPTAK